MDRIQKQQVISDISEELDNSSTIVVIHYKGLTVAEITELRSNMKELGAKLKVIKNRLMVRALEGTKFEALTNLFTGPTAIAFSNDPVAAAKGVVEFAKDNEKLVILGGAINDEVIDIDKVKSLAKLPSLDELRAKIISVINTPATRIAGVVQAPAGQLARVFCAYSESE